MKDEYNIMLISAVLFLIAALYIDTKIYETTHQIFLATGFGFFAGASVAFLFAIMLGKFFMRRGDDS